MIRPTFRLLVQASSSLRSGIPPRTKQLTTIFGLTVHPEPLQHLLKTYDSTLSLLNSSPIPKTAVYRQSVEAIVNYRKSVVESAIPKLSAVPSAAEGSKEENVHEKVIEGVEKEFGVGLIEEVIQQAEDEISLVGKMIEWKSWEDLETPAPPGQWEYFDTPPSNTPAA